MNNEADAIILVIASLNYSFLSMVMPALFKKGGAKAIQIAIF